MNKEPIHKDFLGQDLTPGSKVVWSNMAYAGFEGTFEVLGCSPKMVRIHRPDAKYKFDQQPRSVDPKNLIVVDKLL